MIKAASIAAIGLMAASLGACAGMTGGAPRSDVVANTLGTSPSSAQEFDAQRCGSVEQQGLVGKKVSDIPANIASRARIATGASTGADMQNGRLQILYSASDNTITTVNCG